jgi:copper homeostasis protein
MINIEACIHCDTPSNLQHSVRAAQEGGAARIELCGDMAAHGLTPAREFIAVARDSFYRPGVLVMIRPRGGDFCYSSTEIQTMQNSIDVAADTGADGVVFGVLTPESQLDFSSAEKLIKHAQKNKLSVTFHRAFDATHDKIKTLTQLIDMGVDRILTSGTAWGASGGIADGLGTINTYLEHVAGRVEIVVAGGVSPDNARTIVKTLTGYGDRFSLHAYSGIRKNNVTDSERVRALVNAAQQRAF